MAQKSYEVGYHMVSLGKWNKHMIEKECNINSRLDYITFPYEGKEYFAKERNFDEYKTKKEFNFAVYIKEDKVDSVMCAKNPQYTKQSNQSL